MYYILFGSGQREILEKYKLFIKHVAYVVELLSTDSGNLVTSYTTKQTFFLFKSNNREVLKYFRYSNQLKKKKLMIRFINKSKLNYSYWYYIISNWTTTFKVRFLLKWKWYFQKIQTYICISFILFYFFIFFIICQMEIL